MAPDLDAILSRHTEAMGGADAIEQRRAVDVVLEVAEASFSGTVRYRADRGGLVRVDVFVGDERVFSEGIDSEGPWQLAGDLDDVRPIGEAGVAALRQGIELNLFGLHEYRDRGHRMRLAEPILADAVEYVVLDVVFDFGARSLLLLDPVSCLVERRRDVRAFHPEIDADERSLETVVEEFAPLCGVPWPTVSRQVDFETGETLQRTRTVSRSCNRSGEDAGIGRPD